MNRIPCCLALALSLCAIPGLQALSSADDDEKPKTQTVDAGGLTFEAPADWEKSKPKSQMRKAQLSVKPVGSDKEKAELVVYAFPEGAGTVEANVARWQNQFKDGEGNTPEVQTKKVEGKNVEVTRVEVAGTYTDPFAGTGPQKNFRLLGAIVQTDGAAFYLKMIGPDKTMESIEEDFDELLKSIKETKD